MAGIKVQVAGKGIVDVIVTKDAYPQVAHHWERQLTGARAKRWGRIYIDPLKSEADARRKEAMWQEGPSTRGLPAFNRDECPGAMFIWESQEIADVEVCCATANQAFGRDLYRALKKSLGTLAWWEVRFKFR